MEELKIVSGLNNKERLNDLPENIKDRIYSNSRKIIKQEK